MSAKKVIGHIVFWVPVLVLGSMAVACIGWKGVAIVLLIAASAIAWAAAVVYLCEGG